MSWPRSYNLLEESLSEGFLIAEDRHYWTPNSSKDHPYRQIASHKFRNVTRKRELIIFLYLLDGRGSIPGRGKGYFPVASVQNSSDTHPPSYPMGTVGPFPGVKRVRGVTLTTYPRLVPRSRMSITYTSSLPWRLHGGSGTILPS
jgi:hypothetical protein